MATPQEQGIILIEETLKELESPKTSVASSIKKLKRTAILLNEKELIIWCNIQLGKSEYIIALKKLIEAYVNNEDKKSTSSKAGLDKEIDNLEKIGIILGNHIDNDELTAKANESGGGFVEIDFIEEKYNDLVRTKKGNDGTYYKTNLQNTLATIKSITHRRATDVYKNHAFKELAESNFEVLKRNIEDALFELDSGLAEKMLIVFKSISSDSPEEWSHALTTVRRFFEQLADILYPPTSEKINNRPLKQENYINRIWAFMDNSIKSETNKELAKAHVDFLGSYLQNLFRVSNKGVHGGLSRMESMKAVFHTYLICADILEYLKKPAKSSRLNIHTASLDEIESLLNVSRTIAKEIVRLRVEHPMLSKELLQTIPKLSTKHLNAIQEKFSFEPL